MPGIIKSLANGLLYTSARYLGRRLTGTDNNGGDNNANTMTDSTKDFDAEGVKVGATLRNLTDGCKGIITTVATTVLTCSGGFSGGTDNDFDDGDSYAVFADEFQDLGAAQANWSRQIFIFENLHLIGNGNYLATIDKDEANFNASYKQLRDDWIFRAGAINSGIIAIANNKDFKGKI